MCAKICALSDARSAASRSVCARWCDGGQSALIWSYCSSIQTSQGVELNELEWLVPQELQLRPRTTGETLDVLTKSLSGLQLLCMKPPLPCHSGLTS